MTFNLVEGRFFILGLSVPLSPRLGVGTQICSCMRRLVLFFRVQNFEFQYFGIFFRKLNIFWDMKILWIFFGVIIKLDYINRSFVFILGSFLKVKVQNGGYFLVC